MSTWHFVAVIWQSRVRTPRPISHPLNGSDGGEQQIQLALHLKAKSSHFQNLTASHLTEASSRHSHSWPCSSTSTAFQTLRPIVETSPQYSCGLDYNVRLCSFPFTYHSADIIVHRSRHCTLRNFHKYTQPAPRNFF